MIKQMDSELLADMFDFRTKLKKETDQDSSFNMEKLKNMLDEEEKDWWVVIQNKEIVGEIFIKHFDSHYVLKRIYVLKEYQGKGVSRKLTSVLPRDKDIILHVSAKNERAIGFYNKIGFTLDASGRGLGNHTKAFRLKAKLSISKEDLFDNEEVTKDDEDVDNHEETVGEQDLRDNGKERLKLTKDDPGEGKSELTGDDTVSLSDDQPKSEDVEEDFSNVELTVTGPLSRDVANVLRDTFGYEQKNMATEGTGSVTNKAALIILAKERKYQHNSVRGLGSPFVYVTDDRYLKLASEKQRILDEISTASDPSPIVGLINAADTVPDHYVRLLTNLGARVYYTQSGLLNAIAQKVSS